MKTLNDQSFNQVNIVGKLLDTTFREGKMSDGRDYESVTMTIRVTQTYGGVTETSDIPVSMFAAKYTQKQTLNAGFAQLQELKNAKTAQNVGIDAADTIRINRGSLRENIFVTKSGQLINGWQINTNFVNTGSAQDVATFNMDIYILDIRSEETSDGENTGRLIVKGGIVQYNGTLDVLEFIVEAPGHVNYIERNWNVDDTLNVRGRIRVRAQEVAATSHSSWGEEIPETTTRTVRELIITDGDDAGREEDFAFDPAEIKKGFNARKARIEQAQVQATSKPAAKAAPEAQGTGGKYSWE